ncbi:nuclear transport factor 2 family protein [Labrys wisconsinensis]|uniref:SnoaL-like domain-containing protein n=1 Tax=Labrys wisconsinensis TaxID=425677 RepID=A0ABU0JBZ5_9HYPH|nr:nuclear transport factor 2 family protein [Labrys wisconsinensis]MDQ0471799.1 hypothetical protein [Labrys wisconsinensis]
MSHNAADRQLIQDAIARYAWGFDTADFALLGEAFTEDATSGGVVTGTSIAWGPMRGRDEIVAVLASIRRAQTDQRRHNIGSFLFEKQSATTASVRCYLDLTSTENGTSRLVTGGTYAADLVKQGETWRMSRLDAVLDGPF